MTVPPANDEPIEPLLDALPDGAEREALVARLRRDGRGAEVDASERIDESLRRLFPPETAPDAEAAAVGRAAVGGPASAPTRLWIGAAAATAAAVLLSLSLWPADRGRGVGPHFEPAPLVDLYRDAVAEGFEPYYECRDDARFAAVFAKRQGAPLALATMPEGRHMLGLSYPGGFSRNTTAMLCEVEGRPVMVFVDQEANDQPRLVQAPDGSGLSIFKSGLPGLVVYEVTPLEEPTAAPYLRVPEAG